VPDTRYNETFLTANPREMLRATGEEYL